ncbi:MAG: hypothetical protein ACREYE_31940, partial [Gammaproteobacteria bacterium]
SRFSFMSITMPPMIDPFTTFQTHPSLETRSQVQTHTILEKTPADPSQHGTTIMPKYVWKHVRDPVYRDHLR